MNRKEVIDHAMLNIGMQREGKTGKAIYVKGPSGCGKTELFEYLEKDTMVITLIGSQMEVSDIGLYGRVERPDGSLFLGFIPNELIALTRDVVGKIIIFFDELPRAALDVRNAILQMITQRRYGAYKFGNNVAFCAAGNLGSADGNEGDDFDAALKDRLQTVTYQPETREWITWAKEKGLNSRLLEFYSAREAELNKVPKDGEDNFPTSRSVTFLADAVHYVLKDKDDREDYKKVKEVVDKYGFSMIGASYKALSQFLEEQSTFTFRDILKDYSKIRKDVQERNRSRRSEWLHEIKKLKFSSLSLKEVKNLSVFLEDCDADEVIGYIDNLIPEIKSNPDFAKMETWLWFKEEPKNHELLVQYRNAIKEVT